MRAPPLQNPELPRTLVGCGLELNTCCAEEGREGGEAFLEALGVDIMY